MLGPLLGGLSMKLSKYRKQRLEDLYYFLVHCDGIVVLLEVTVDVSYYLDRMWLSICKDSLQGEVTTLLILE